MNRDYYNTKESVEEYVTGAKDADGGKLIDKLKKVLPIGSKLLEIGSGPGTDWEILNQSYEVVGSDNSDEFIKHLKVRHPSGEFLNIDAATVNTDKMFDGIYSNKVLHHLKNEELISSIQKQSDVLQPNGIICHSFWKGKDSEVIKGFYSNYHDEKEIERFFKDHFDIISITSYTEFEEGDSILLIGKKK